MHAINSREFTWSINDIDLMHQIMNANIDETFEGPEFDILNLKFVLEITPNAKININDGEYAADDMNATATEYWVEIALKLKSFPSKIDRIIMCVREYSEQLNSSLTSIFSFSKTNLIEFTEHVLYSYMKDMSLTSLNITVWINILKIFVQNDKSIDLDTNSSHNINYAKQQRIIWNVEGDILDSFKKASVGKRFESKIFDNMWTLVCFPNGEWEQDTMGLYIQLCCLPPEVKQLKIKWLIKCIEIDFEWQDESSLDCEDSAIGYENEIDSETLGLCSSLTIQADIEIIEEIRERENDFVEVCDEYQIRDLLIEIKDEQENKDEDVEMSVSNKYVNYLELDEYMIKIDDESLNKLSTAQLMQRLKSHDLPINGLKHELIQRWKKYKLNEK